MRLLHGHSDRSEVLLVLWGVTVRMVGVMMIVRTVRGRKEMWRKR